MSRLFYTTMQDNAGNLLFGVSGTMRLAGTSTLATIYGDEALTVILPNPLTNHPSFGSFKCYLGPGSYDFYMAKAGYAFETMTGVQGGGTLSSQDANAVAITGGTITGLSSLICPGVSQLTDLGVTTRGFAQTWGVGQGYVTPGLVLDVTGVASIDDLGVTTRGYAQTWGVGQSYVTAGLVLEVTGNTRHSGWTGMNLAFSTNVPLSIGFDKSAQSGQLWKHLNSDTGAGAAVLMQNVAGTQIGSISTTASAVAYNTTSDSRLKRDVTPLTGALDVVRRLRPVAFLWNADGSPGRGFVADEVADVVDGVITGERDAVDDEGNILPQMIDHSKLVVYLVGACKELAAQVAALTARLDAVGG